MVNVTLEHIDKSFGTHEVLKDISLEVTDRTFVALVGPSGCGKSTLLRVIAGLESVNGGDIRFDGRRMNDVPAPDRAAAMVFQSYALYPHMTVWENISFSLRLKGVSRTERRQRAADVARLLQLDELLDRRPGQLSGGQRQRVAIGRALMRKPDVFLFDEPLSNLDAALRGDMRVELTRLHQSIGNTMIYVTHDQMEAMTMADQIVVLHEGRIMQVGAPMELYTRPASRFVAEFIGAPRINLIDAKVTARTESTTSIALGGAKSIELPAHAVKTGTAVTLGVRPEDIDLHNVADDSHADVIDATVDVVEHLGAEALIYARVDGLTEALRFKTEGKTPLATSDRVRLTFKGPACHLFDDRGERVERVSNSALERIM